VLVGQLYSRDDIRRDPAFSIFYMGINTGAWLVLIVIGILGETVGWSYGFGATEIGMLIGLGIFILFRRELQARACRQRRCVRQMAACRERPGSIWARS
jgi:POT family proton-dependent oligopeptide transporter